MKLIGNILWFIFGGFVQGLSWVGIGLLWCITIIGIPVGIQCFKLAQLQFFPFGKEVITTDDSPTSFLLNILWLIFGGFALALGNLIAGIILCVTIIGIPFGLQSFKLAKLSLMPFGKDIR
ncbi:MAG: YccF domain-containing protein [Sarcina sp.]